MGSWATWEGPKKKDTKKSPVEGRGQSGRCRGSDRQELKIKIKIKRWGNIAKNTRSRYSTP